MLIPLTALIIGTSVLGAEIDDGSIVHLLATPVRRSSVVMTKFVIATGLTMIFAAIPELIAALIAGGGIAPAPAGTGPGPAGLRSAWSPSARASWPSACSSGRWPVR